MLSCTCSNSWKRFIQFSSILFLLGLGMVLAVPTSSDSGGGGRWEWDEEQERRVFFPEGPGPQRPSPGMDSDISPNGVPSPYIEADPQYEWIYGWDWPVGNTVYVCVNSSGFAADPTNPSQCDLFASSMVASGTYGMVDFNVWSFFDMQGGEYIAMTDTVTTKQHQVTSLTVTEVDAVADTVTGTADPGSMVYVYEYGGANWLYPVADGSGDWLANYSGIYDLVPGDDGFASQYDADSDMTWWGWEEPNPTITADPGSDQINGDEWPVGETVYVCVTSSGYAADPTIPAQCDLYDANAVVDPPSFPMTAYVTFNLAGSHDLQSGDYIAMTDGTTTKQHQVTALAVTGVDPVTDIVSGTATPSAALEVVKYGCSGCTLYSNADGSGDWSVDFSSIGQDIQPGDSGFATEPDIDGDETWVRWNVPNPFISTSPVYDDVYANDWPIGATVHVCIDDTGFAADPTISAQCDLFYDSATITDPGGGTVPYHRFEVGSLHDLMAGDYIAMTDGTTTKQHQVTNLDVTGVDPVTDIVSGTADPGSNVEVAIYDPYIVILDVVANGSGAWEADFTSQMNLVAGSSGYASQYDPDEDETWERWEVLNPIISALPIDNNIHGYNWPEGETVHVCVDDTGFAADPTNPAQCDLFHASQVVPTADPSGTFINFNLSGGHSLAGGDFIAMTDGILVKQHQVTSLSIIGKDHQTDTISGTAEPSSDVEVWVFECPGCVMDVAANGSGNWEADFSSIAVDIQPGDYGSAAQYDPDEDETVIYWSIPVYELFLPLILR